MHYPILVRAKAARLAELARKVKITVALDSLAAAETLSAAAAAAGSTLHVLAEFDSGMRRCGVETAEQMACSRARNCDTPQFSVYWHYDLSRSYLEYPEPSRSQRSPP